MSGDDGLGDDRARNVRDHTDAGNKLKPIADASAKVRADIERVCAWKRGTVDAREQVGARISPRRRDKGPCFAYAGHSPATGHVVAIKYRPINGDSHTSFAEEPSVWLQPIVIGKLTSLDWLIAEGETEAARLWGFV